MKPAWDSMLCLRCAACVGTCPVGAINLRETGLTIGDDCTGCGTCVKMCPVGALEAGE